MNTKIVVDAMSGNERMEAGDHFKNGASLKSHTSKRNNLIVKTCFALGVTVLFFNSCISTNRAFQSSPVISRNVTLDPIKADITVDESRKLSGESMAKYFLFFRVEGGKHYADGIDYSTGINFKVGRLNRVRSAAAFNALQNGDYDVLVHPTYETRKENYLGIVKVFHVKVAGYGAKYSNFRTERQKIIITANEKEYVFPDHE